MTETIIKAITSEGKVSRKIQNEYFAGKDFRFIRDWLEENHLDRHMALELESTEIAIMCPKGLILQKRACDNDAFGLWGGALIHGEEPDNGAIRELQEETGLIVEPNQLRYMSIDKHSHEYANGDKAIFTAYRYLLELDYVPEIKLEGSADESSGICFLSILDHQIDFVCQLLQMYRKK